jgi:hypothetical protein
MGMTISPELHYSPQSPLRARKFIFSFAGFALFAVKDNAPNLWSGRLVCLVFMDLFMFTRQPPISRHKISDSSIVVGGSIKDKH